MGLHSATWRIHASAVDDLALLEGSLRWLAGEDCEMAVERGKSWHGSEQTILEATTKRKKDALQALARLGDETLTGLLEEGVSKRIDDEKVMHIRIGLSRLVRGEVALVTEDDAVATAKGQFKIEAYPGSEPSVVITETILSMLDS
jgi:RNA binding exosome subunit